MVVPDDRIADGGTCASAPRRHGADYNVVREVGIHYVG
jgi:hypothetical protein